MATIPLGASGAAQGHGTADLWYVEEPFTRFVLAVGGAGAAGVAVLDAKRRVSAVGVSSSSGRAELFRPAGRGVGQSVGAARLGGTFQLAATGTAGSCGRASLLPHGSLSVIWIMKVR